MKVLDATRGERKAAVLGAMQKLREDFPLQKTVEAAAPSLQFAYVRALVYWTRHGMPPPNEFASEAAVRALCERDALVMDARGIGCYPFSARDTGIHVRYAGHTVSAMCAIDALAIPRLVRCPSRISTRCAVCGRPLACTVMGNGSVEGGNPGGLRVIWRPRAVADGACCHSLCPGIGFVCQHCTEPHGATGLTLAEAAVVGNSFFAFQRRLLDHHA